MDNYYEGNMFVVKYSGPFGFIKPWTAVRDSETFSQQFLTPSIIEGIEKKLFPELLETEGIKKIVRHRLTYYGLSSQQEQTQPRGVSSKINTKKKKIEILRPKSILKRSVLLNPVLYLGFKQEEDAKIASTQHICLCRNEDILMPDSNVLEVSSEEFDNQNGNYRGFELIFEKNNDSFLVGSNRFMGNKFMYGRLHIVGENPLLTY